MTSEQTQFQLSGDRLRSSKLSQQPTQPPTTVPGYTPQRFLGAGAYGQVWVAVDKNTGRQVAIKFFEHRAGVNWSLLSREVEKLVFLTADRHVVQLHEVGWDSDPPYYVMEYVENGSLDDRLQSRGPMSVTEAVSMFRDVVTGMTHAHRKGVLHCDLKPANILLDHEEKPRIADFGQSRLTSEQTPALGTLFYMPAEQASLDSVPDARWDVYALGALLYSMIMGRPPHRSGEAVSEIDSSSSLEERLNKYREFIKNAPPVTDHRKVKGVDRALADIIERCLATNPDQRFPTVLSVREALDRREEARVRRPLQLLGIVGPLLLLLTAGIFGFRAYKQAIKRAEDLALIKSHDENRFAARANARVVGTHIERRFSILEEVSQDKAFVQMVNELITDKTARAHLEVLGDPAADKADFRKARDEFQVMALRNRYLQPKIEDFLSDPRLPSVASWFITDSKGTMLAAAFPDDNIRTPVGKNYRYRSYFHGGQSDIVEDLSEANAAKLKPLNGIQLSAPFTSTATTTYKVAISAPVKFNQQTIGVVAVTLELGDFVEFPESSNDFCAVLIDGRASSKQGIIFQHPLLAEIKGPNGNLPESFDIGAEEFRADLKTLRDDHVIDYVDPLGNHELGIKYAGKWIAAAAPVTFPRLNNQLEFEDFDTGLLLAVERRVDAVIEPVGRLADTLLREAIFALVMITIVSMLLWYFVLRMMRDSLNALRSKPTSGPDQSVHSRDTIAMPVRILGVASKNQSREKQVRDKTEPDESKPT